MINISFADLTHTGQIVAANTFPLGISYVAATAKKHFNQDVNIEIFKYPEDFNNYLSKNLPDVACFSSNCWNIRLAHAYAKELKRLNDKILIVFGGPNFPSDSKEQENFLKEFDCIDFYIEFEGEFNFVELFEKFFEYNFNLKKIKESNINVPNLRYIHDNIFVKNDIRNKIKDLNQIPSPYLENLMDKFFDEILIPCIQTTRGCPYTCAFCWEGGEYFRKTNRFDMERIYAEMEYIAKRAKVSDLQITDANFGMFKEDLLTTKNIIKLQKEYNYPQTVFAATAKNHKERTIEIVDMLGDTLPATAAVQSTDDDVLVNIKRSNVSQDTLVTMGKAIEKRGGQSEAELILCLEGDTAAKHKKTVYDMLDADMKFIRMYQFMMLPGTHSASTSNREKFGIKTKYRVLPRCFGVYNVLNKNLPIAEVEEIIIENNTMPYKDYLKMRDLHLTVEIFNNDSIFLDLVNLLKLKKIPRSVFIERIHNKIKSYDNVFKKLYEDFNAEEYRNLSDKINLLEKTNNIKTIKQYIDGELGTNELYKYRVIAIFNHIKLLHDIAYFEAKLLLKENKILDTNIVNYLSELYNFSLLRKQDPLNAYANIDNKQKFSYNFIRLLELNFDCDPMSFKLDAKVKYNFYHSDQQKDLIQSYFNQYGRDIIGLSRIVLRANMNRLHRSVSSKELGNFHPVEEEYNKRQKQKMIA